MRNISVIVISAFVLSGCVFMQEPYPGWTVIDLPYDNLPRKVKTAFREDFGGVRVTKVERSTFESRMSGHPKKYRVFFEKPDTGVERAIYDPKGKRDDGFDFWFHRNSESAEPGCSSERAGCALVPLRASWAARH